MMRLAPELVTPPATRLLDLGEAKQHLRVSHSGDDTAIEAMILAVEQHLDGYSGITGRALINQTWRETFEGFSACGWLDLCVGRVQSVASVKYFEDGVPLATTFPADNYRLLRTPGGGCLELVNGESWPDGLQTRSDAVQVEYVAGYGATADKVPAPIRHAAKLLLGDLYENRETFVVGSISVRDLPTVDRLLAGYRRSPG